MWSVGILLLELLIPNFLSLFTVKPKGMVPNKENAEKESKKRLQPPFIHRLIAIEKVEMPALF
jgi:hypothetical protein